jgi:STE24 endopeptidase
MLSRLLLLFALLVAGLSAQPSQSPTLHIPAGAQASAGFNPETATQTYLDTIPPDKKARSDAYFEGGYWLIL